VRCGLVGDTGGLAGDGAWAWSNWAWSTHATVSASQEQTLSGTGVRVYTAHRGWLGVVTGISAASTGGVVVQRLYTLFHANLPTPLGLSLGFSQ